MERPTRETPKKRRARVMLFEDNGADRDILYGKWQLVPWGMHNDVCYAIRLKSGQELHVWLEGVTDRPWSAPDWEGAGEPAVADGLLIQTDAMSTSRLEADGEEAA